MPANLETQQWPQDWKRLVFIPIPKKGNAKEYSNYCTIALISHASQAMCKIPRMSRCSNWIKKRQRNKRSNCQHPLDHQKSKRIPEKNIYFCFIDYAKPLTLWITINCGKLWKRWEYQTIWPVSCETYMQVRKQQLELDIEQQTGSK